jgi:hypothetical protein
VAANVAPVFLSHIAVDADCLRAILVEPVSAVFPRTRNPKLLAGLDIKVVGLET